MSSILKVSEIQDPTNGNSALTVNSSGYMTTPNRPAFWVGMATTPAAANSAVIKFDTVKKDDFNLYSTSTGRFTAPISGWYQFTFTLLYQGVATTDDGIHTHLRVNGASDTNTWLFDRADGQDANGYSGYGGYLNSKGSVGIYLDANDYVEIYYSATGAISVHGNENKSWTQWSGYLVG